MFSNQVSTVIISDPCNRHIYRANFKGCEHIWSSLESQKHTITVRSKSPITLIVHLKQRISRVDLQDFIKPAQWFLRQTKIVQHFYQEHLWLFGDCQLGSHIRGIRIPLCLFLREQLLAATLQMSGGIYGSPNSTPNNINFLAVAKPFISLASAD